MASLTCPVYNTAMTCDDLTTAQAQKVAADIERQRGYLNRLAKRMQALQFVPSDPLLRATIAARNAMQDLRMAAHYAGCGGVGRQPKAGG